VRSHAQAKGVKSVLMDALITAEQGCLFRVELAFPWENRKPG
jgi:hypothetical protein